MVANYSFKNNFKNKAYNVQYILASFEIFTYYFDSCQLIYAYKLHCHYILRRKLADSYRPCKKMVPYDHLEFQTAFMMVWGNYA